MVEQAGRGFLDISDVRGELLVAPSAHYESLEGVFLAAVLSDGRLHWATFRREAGGLRPERMSTFLISPHKAVEWVRRHAHAQGYSRRVDGLLMLPEPAEEIR